jgi:hypothetical protein
MNKKTIETFITKYNLGGLIEKVRWTVKDKTLRVTAITSDKKFLVSVTQKKFEELTDTAFGVMDSNKFKTLLGAIAENASINLQLDPNDQRVLAVDVDDGKSECSLPCAHLDVLDKEPTVKQLPSYDVEIKLTDEFIERFRVAKAALSEIDLFTLVMNKKKQILQMVLGYNRNLTNRIALQIDTLPGKDTVKAPISFSAKNLKEVLAANTESKDAILKVSEAGLAFVEFDTPEFQSQYYMIKIDVED